MAQIDVYNEIKGYILQLRSDIATNPGSVTSDAVITPQSYVVYKNRVLISYAEALQTLFSISLLINNQAALQEIANVELESVDQVSSDISGFIDKIGINFGKVRFGATPSTGTIYFGRNELASTQITINQFQMVSTLGNIQFSLDQSVIMNANDPSYYNIDYRRYLVAGSITCTQTGSIGNVVSGSISQIVGSITGINYVTNIDNFTNGQDAETDAQYINRLQSVLSGNTFGSLNGYKNLIMTNFRNVKDVLVVTPGNPLMTRDNGLGGMVDIYVLAEVASTNIIEPFTGFDYYVDGLNYKGVILSNNPVDPNSAVTPSAATGVFVKDTSGLSNSMYENSIVYFSTPPTGSFSISYNYYPLISSPKLDNNGNPMGIQPFINQDQYAILGNVMTNGDNQTEAMVLVKMAIQTLINITATIVVLTGYDSNLVISNCATAVNNYIAGLGLGMSLSQSQISAVIQEVSGVSSVNDPFTIFNVVGQPVAEIDTITCADNSYIRLGSNSLIITI